MRSTRLRSRWSREGARRCSDLVRISSQVRPRNSTSVRISSSLALAAAVRTVFRRGDLPRDADVIHGGHVHQEAPGQRYVAGDARAFFAEGFLGDLDDDLLARPEHFGDELRAARSGMAVAALAMRRAAPGGTPATAAHRPLESST